MLFKQRKGFLVASCLEDEVIPKEWEAEFKEPDGAALRDLNALAFKGSRHK